MTAELTSHWARSSWKPGERRMHWYVLPPEESWGRARSTQDAVARPELTAIPGPWLHCTIIALRDSSTVSSEDRSALLEVGRAALSDVAPFDTMSGQPSSWGEAVVFDLSPSAGLDLLHRRLTDASELYLPGPKPTRFIPHITFSYVHAQAEGATTVAAIADPALVLPSFRVQEAWLLDVLQEPGPDRGWYSWDVVGSAPLAG